MAIYAQSTGNSTPKVESGTYVGRCFQMIEIGTLMEAFKNEPAKSKQKVRLSFELPTEHFEYEKDGVKISGVRTVSKEFVLSMHEKSSLRKFLEMWRGKKYTEEEAKKVDITKLLGQPCMLALEAKENGYPEIKGASMPVKGMSIPDAVNPISELSYDNWNEELFQSLPEFVRKKMEETPEYNKLRGVPVYEDMPPAIAGDDDTGLPF